MNLNYLNCKIAQIFKKIATKIIIKIVLCILFGRCGYFSNRCMFFTNRRKYLGVNILIPQYKYLGKDIFVCFTGP